MLSPAELLERAGVVVSDLGLVQRALTHRSYVNENPDALEDNERLEFLGDAALDFLTAAWLYNHFPEVDEGKLTRLRSALVRTEQLAAFAEDIDLGQALRLGRGEHQSGGRKRAALLCAGFEAFIGAIYLDAGWRAVSEFMEPRIKSAVESILEDDTLFDARSLLQIWAQSDDGRTPSYHTVEESGPDHERHFVVEVRLGDRVLGRGGGTSKQEAAQEAAEHALEEVGWPDLDLG